MSHVFIIGCGDIGQRVAALWLQQGVAVRALSHRLESRERLQSLGIQTVAGDLDHPDSLTGLPLAGALLYYFAPPPADGDVDSRVRNLMPQLAAQPPERLVYISTTGVYGDCQGAWVTEQTPVNIQSARARRRWDAEQCLQDWGQRSSLPVVILRVGGIYGPGRLPLQAVREGRPVLRPAEAPYSNRIHADDLARACVAAAERGQAGAIYNACDGQQSTMSDYFNSIADRLGVPRPPEISMAEAQQVLSPAMLSYLRQSRRIDNRKLCEELRLELRYPTLEAGLAHCGLDDSL